jgi:archaellum biogenesis ATPase FlaH
MQSTKWLVEGLYPEGHIILMVGQPTAGKSWTAAQAAADVDAGTKHFGKFKTTQGPVFYIDEDTPTNVFQQRLSRLSPNHTIECMSMSGFRLSAYSRRHSLVSDIKACSERGSQPLVIIDCLGKVMAGVDLDKAAKAADAMAYLAELRDAGSTVLVVHHCSLKSSVYAGMPDLMGKILNSTLIVSSSDTAFGVFKVPVDSATIFTIQPVPRRVDLGIREPFSVQLKEDKKRTYARLRLMAETPVLPTGAAKLLIRLFPDPQTRMTVASIEKDIALDLSRPDIREGLKELVHYECLKKTVDAHDKSHKVTYSLHPDYDANASFYKAHLV